MAYLSAAVVLVGIIGLLNLILTVGVIRRLREHDQALADGRAGTLKLRADAGARVGDFTATTLDGGTVATATLVPGTLVGVFAPACAPCKEVLPAFVEHAATRPGGRDRVIAVLSGDMAAMDPMIAALAPVARVIVEAPDGVAAAAFDVSAFPSLFRIGDTGTIAASGGRLHDITTPAAAPGPDHDGIGRRVPSTTAR